MQAHGGGTISAAQRKQLSDELAAAKHLPPKGVTPFECGVPL
jgi:hypothetical protein